MKKILFSFELILICTFLYGQDRFVHGYVTDKDGGESIIGAAVVSGNKGTVTGQDGYYSLRIPEGNHVIICTYVGYSADTLTLNISRDTLINFTLQAGEFLQEASIVGITETDIRSAISGASTVTQADILHFPSPLGEADLLRMVQLLPGIQGGVSGSTSLYVRGGGPDENLYLIDGVPIYNVAHLLGIFSAFPPEAIKKTDIFKGSFPAKYGGRTSSVLDIYTNDGNSRRLSGSISAGLLNSRIHLEGPLGGHKTTFSISGRALHTLFAQPFISKDTYQTWFSFYDLNARITHRFSDNDLVSASFYSGKDDFSYTGNEVLTRHDEEDFRTHEAIEMNWGNTMGASRWNHVFSGRLNANAYVGLCSFGMLSDYSSTDISRSLEETVTSSRMNTSMIDKVAAVNFNGIITDRKTIHLGIASTIHDCNPYSSFKSTTGMNSSDEKEQPISGVESALYGEDEITLPSGTSARIGIRFSLMSTSGKHYCSPEPRLSLRQDFGKGIAAKISFARLSQYVHLLSSSNISLPTDLWVPSTPDVPPVYASHTSLGLYYDGLHGWEFSTECYYKLYDNVLEYKDGVSFARTTLGWEDSVAMGEGKSYGVELFAKKTSGRLTGSASYVLSDALRRFPDKSINNGLWFHSKYARRHCLSVSGTYCLSATVRLNATWSFASGSRISLPEGTSIFPSSSSFDNYYVIDYNPNDTIMYFLPLTL